MRNKPTFWLGVILLGLVLLPALGAPLLSPHQPEAIPTPATPHAPPSSRHWFGTDQFGRDVFARVMHGGRISLIVALTVTAGAISLGGLYGALAGYVGGKLDRVLMYVVDTLLAFPLLFWAITLMAVVGGGLPWLMVILILGSWMDIARLVRAQVLSLKHQPFILKARAAGLPDRRILFRHLLPNLFATLLAAAILRSADVILAESTLSFLGMGAQPPAASWGTILLDGKALLATAWWVSLFPGMAIVMTVLGLHCLGESLQRS